MSFKTLGQSTRMRGEERREQILSTACELFSSSGYDAVTTKQLAMALGCSEGLIFRYFPSKEAIYDTLMQEWEVGMGEPVEFELVYGSAIKTLECLYNEIMITPHWNWNKNSRPNLEPAVFSRTSMSHEHRKIVAQSPDAVTDIIAPLIQLGQKAGEIREGDPIEIALLLWSTIAGSRYILQNCPDNYRALSFSSVSHILR